MVKFAIGVVFIGSAVFAIFVFWALKPFETAMIATANQSASVNMSNYYGYVETVNYWPFLGWLGFGMKDHLLY